MSIPATRARQFFRLTVFIVLIWTMIPQWAISQTLRPAHDPPGLSEITLGGASGWPDIDVMDNLSLVPGWRGGEDIVITDQSGSVSGSTDLFARFDYSVGDFTGSYSLQMASGVRHSTKLRRFGAGAAAFDGKATLSFVPEEGSVFSPYTQPGSFILDMWVYPMHIAEGSEVLRWSGALVNAGHPVLQEVRFEVDRGRFRWVLRDVVVRSDRDGDRILSGAVLSARRGPVPNRWTHHRLRYDAERSQLAYLVDGSPEAITYLTDTGEEEGNRHALLFGADTGEGLTLGAAFHGLIDDLRIERTVDTPIRSDRYTNGPGELVSSPIPLGPGGGEVYAIRSRTETPGNTEVRLYYRVGDTLERDGWIPVSGDGIIRDSSRRGRYLQLRAHLLNDASRERTPRLQAIEITYRPFASPSPPRGVSGEGIPGGVEIRWDAVLSENVVDYRVLFGEEPGRYLGTRGIGTPISSGGERILRIEGLEPDRSYVFAVESVDRYGQRSALSREIEVRAGGMDR